MNHVLEALGTAADVTGIVIAFHLDGLVGAALAVAVGLHVALNLYRRRAHEWALSRLRGLRRPRRARKAPVSGPLAPDPFRRMRNGTGL